MYLFHFKVTEYLLIKSNIHYKLKASDHQQKNDTNLYLVYALWFQRFTFFKHTMFTHRKAVGTIHNLTYTTFNLKILFVLSYF